MKTKIDECRDEILVNKIALLHISKNDICSIKQLKRQIYYYTAKIKKLQKEKA